MTTIHLTDAQRDRFAATGMFVIDKLVPPEGWRILTEPCDTCHGSTVDVIDTGEAFRVRDCPDCVGGRRVVTLTATCPRCQTDPPCEHKLESGSHGWGCTKCGLSGVGPLLWHRDGTKCENRVVTLGRFTIPALLPVVANPDTWPTEPSFVVWDESMLSKVGTHSPCWIYAEDGVYRPVKTALDPLPRPGQFIARPERVE